jgi:DUF1680 family protein
MENPARYGEMIYAHQGRDLIVNLFISSTLTWDDLTVTQDNHFPQVPATDLTLSLKRQQRFAIKIRQPWWADGSMTVSVNGSEVKPKLEDGYLVVSRKWKDGDVITLDMDMPVKVVAADPRVKEDVGKRAVQRGPLVYCVEEADNKEGFDDLRIAEDAKFDISFDAGKLGGIMGITAHVGDQTLNYIPYYSWDNREAGKMKVWVPLVVE